MMKSRSSGGAGSRMAARFLSFMDNPRIVRPVQGGESFMAKQIFRDGTEVVGFYARTIKSGPFVFVSGTTSLDSKGRVQGRDAGEQTLVTMRKIAAGLKSAGATLRDLTRLTIFVTDIRDMGAVSKALAQPPNASLLTSTLVPVSALPVPRLLAQLESTAAVKG